MAGLTRTAGTWIALVLLMSTGGSRSAVARDAQNDELRKQIQALSDSVRAMQKDLQEIKALLLQGRPPVPPQNVVLDLGANPIKGEKSAAVILIEFTDYQCPFCARYFRDTYPEIEKEYIETGKLRYALMDLPLESIHKNAFRAAEVANCAGEQGKYWEMHDRLFTNQQTLDSWNAHAEAVGLDLTRFESCLTGGSQQAEIRKDMAQARSAGITGTPAFFLVVTDGTSKVKPVAAIRGAQPFAAFKVEIDRVLQQPTR